MSQSTFEALLGSGNLSSTHCYLSDLIPYFFLFFLSCIPYIALLTIPLVNFLKTFVLAVPLACISAWPQGLLPHLLQGFAQIFQLFVSPTITSIKINPL
uniref:Uncharacterized protein n=1 Tax=Macaca fascicularis TaxID=9541 RepID=Q8I002_MACFA|nr:hypothetical protein [Macaca fascicularis]